jgi:hypothetical protein
LKRILSERLGTSGRGVIKEICDFTGLERHTVSNLWHNKTKYVSLDTLGQICKYLIESHSVPPSQLPGLLFRFEATGFWQMLVQGHVEICLGVRSEPSRPEPRWMNAYDSYLHGVLLNELFAAGHEHTHDLSQLLVRSFTRQRGGSPALAQAQRRSRTQTQKEASQIYERFRRRRGSRALVCLGSVKSNPVSELIAANAFPKGARPFEPEDRVSNPRQRNCPIYIEYRENDPHPPSCHAGLRQARSRRGSRPGVHFETENGTWEYCPVSAQQDAALVLYVYRADLGTLEMVLAGFSGRATGCMALELRELTDQLWPPNYVHNELNVGVFVLRFEFADAAATAPDEQHTLVKPSCTEVIPLATDVLKRRLE